MWTSQTHKNTKTWTPNHFVPLLLRKKTVTNRLHNKTKQKVRRNEKIQNIADEQTPNAINCTEVDDTDIVINDSDYSHPAASSEHIPSKMDSLDDISLPDYYKVTTSPRYLKSAPISGTWADHVLVQAMSYALGRHIWIVTSLEESTSLGQLVNKIECGVTAQKAKPFLLGHEGEYHYHSLGKVNLIVTSNDI